MVELRNSVTHPQTKIRRPKCPPTVKLWGKIPTTKQSIVPPPVHARFRVPRQAQVPLHTKNPIFSPRRLTEHREISQESSHFQFFLNISRTFHQNPSGTLPTDLPWFLTDSDIFHDPSTPLHFSKKRWYRLGSTAGRLRHGGLVYMDVLGCVVPAWVPIQNLQISRLPARVSV